MRSLQPYQKVQMPQTSLPASGARGKARPTYMVSLAMRVTLSAVVTTSNMKGIPARQA